MPEVLTKASRREDWRRISAELPIKSPTTHLEERPCYQRGSPCQDPAGYLTTRRPPDDRKETQTAVVWTCIPFIRSGQNHFARRSERGKKTRRTEEEVGRQHQGMDRSGIRQVPEGSGEQRKIEKTGCKIIFGAPTTLAVKGLMIIMMMRYVGTFSCSISTWRKDILVQFRHRERP